MSTYPPERHVVRDLRLETMKQAVDHALVWAPVQENVRTRAGTLHLGVITTLIDSAGALVALPAATPDWIATADLSYHSIRPIEAGPAICSSRLVRAGATIVIVGVEVFDGLGSDSLENGRIAGTGLMTFSRIPASASVLKVDPLANIGVRMSNAIPGAGYEIPLHDKLGLRVVDSPRGVVELDKSDYVRNSFGTINGGAMTMLCEAAAAEAANAIGAVGYVASDLQVHYLAQTKRGPARTSARVLRHDERHAVCDVRVVDAGEADQILALATVTLRSVVS